MENNLFGTGNENSNDEYEKLKKKHKKTKMFNSVLIFGLGFMTWQNVLVQRLLGNPIELEVEEKMNIVYDYLEEYYVDELDTKMMQEGIYAGIVAGVQDPYTYYLTADDLSRYLESNNGHFVGIGIELMNNMNNEAEIVGVFEYNPAWEAGILPGDIIKVVNGIDVEGMAVSEITTIIKGKIGDTVTLTMEREGKNIDFEIVLDDIVTHTVSHELLTDDMGYIKISGFKENTYEQFMIALRNLQSQNMKGLIIDLRNNLGGLVNSVYDIAEELIPSGILVGTVDKDGKSEDLVLDDKYLEIPMVVLVNENSASASEIFAGAAKDHNVATIVGTQTYGKGLVQGLYTLPDNSAINITIKKYSTPSGEYIHGIGIEPDVVVEMPEDYIQGTPIEKEDDTQLQTGIEIMEEKLGVVD